MKNICVVFTASIVVFTVANEVQAGRWLSRDPIQDGAGFVMRTPTKEPNLYEFVLNDPNDHSDYLGLLTKTVKDSTWSKSNAGSANVTYPSKGPYDCVCGGKTIGTVYLRYAWIDADTQDTIKNADQAAYNWVTSNFNWNNSALNKFNSAGYIGAGVAIEFVPNRYGIVCCQKMSWKQDMQGTIFGWNSDTSASGNIFVDSPGGLNTQVFTKRSQTYRLRILCDNKVAAEYTWSYSADPAAGPPPIGPEVTLTTPF